MKKIINGKSYSTLTAKCIGTTGTGGSGIYDWFEELYMKKTGEFFLYGEGGAGTKYSINVGNNVRGGSWKITPLSLDEAKKWVEEHCSFETYKKLFGEVEE